ncbi:hypothetical protein, partial [uncultured Duncaniella sp.]
TARRGFTACLLLFLFKLVMESPLGLRSLPAAIRILNNNILNQHLGGIPCYDLSNSINPNY